MTATFIAVAAQPHESPSRYFGPALLLAWVVLSFIILARRGFAPGRLIASTIVLLLAGLLGAIPGFFFYVGVVTGVATGVIPGARQQLALAQIVALGGCSAGVVTGLFLVRRLLGVEIRLLRIFWSLLGLSVGMGIALLGLLFAEHTRLETCALVLGPVAMASSALFGFCLTSEGSNRS